MALWPSLYLEMKIYLYLSQYRVLFVWYSKDIVNSGYSWQTWFLIGIGESNSL